MDALTLFGLFAVTAMLVCYALEDRSHWFVLLFAASCALGSAYGFLQGPGRSVWSRQSGLRCAAAVVGQAAMISSSLLRHDRKPLSALYGWPARRWMNSVSTRACDGLSACIVTLPVIALRSTTARGRSVTP